MTKAVQNIIPEQMSSSDCAKALRAIGDQTRIKILRLLLQGERSVLDIAGSLDMAQSHVSHHLTVLRNAKLVKDDRIGKRIMYSIHPSVKTLQKCALDLGCCQLEFNP